MKTNINQIAKENMDKVQKALDMINIDGIGNCIAVRWDEKEFNAGDTIPNSFEWIDDEQGDELDGTCAICITDDYELDLDNLPTLNGTYQGNLYIVVGNLESWGTDPHEVILSNCQVV